jgi:hypothetical protein
MVLLLSGPYFFPLRREFMRASLGKLASAASGATYPILASYGSFDINEFTLTLTV